MRIASVDTELYRIPRGPGLSSASASIEATSMLVARVRSEDGVEGMGWTYSHGSAGASLKTAVDTLFAPPLVGEEADDIQRLWHNLWFSIFPNITMAGVTTVAMAPVDIALWDLAAKAAGKPLFRLLGGYRESAPVYGSGIDLAYTTEELLEEVGAFARDGYWGVKIKVGRESLEEDVQRLRAVRDVIGPHFRLMVDANQRWNVGEALLRAQAMEEFNLFWLEEPIIAEDHAGYERLSRTVSVPLAGGEGHLREGEFLDLFQRACIQYVQADVCRVGGITPWLKIAALADSYHLPMAPHLVEEISVHLACGVPNGYLVEHLPTLNLNNTGIVADPLMPKQGTVTPREEPGHAVHFDPEALAKLRVE